ncbi:MAG: flagellar biosynthetic protein FliR [Robiginitomaculum sp.]|nr:flagellar biosynthetic protein FliR [Robiginitomaculum sp.]
MDFLQIISDLVLKNFGAVFPVMAVLTRISVFIFLLPGLGENAIPTRVRLVTALLITVLIIPFVGIDATIKDTQWNVSTMVAVIAFEGFYGFVLGFGLRLMVFGLQIAGSIISQNLSLTQVFGGGMTSEPNTTISTILMLGGVTLLLTLDMHTKAVGLLVRSYEIFPLASTPVFEDTVYWVAQKTVGVFSFAVTLALPLLVFNFIYNLMLGFVNKAMPQLMVSFVGMPFVTGAGIILLALSISGILTVWLNTYDTHMAEMF